MSEHADRLSADEIEDLRDRVIEGLAADDRQSMKDYDEALAALRRLTKLALTAERLRAQLTEAIAEARAWLGLHSGMHPDTKLIRRLAEALEAASA